MTKNPAKSRMMLTLALMKIKETRQLQDFLEMPIKDALLYINQPIRHDKGSIASFVIQKLLHTLFN